MKYSILRFSLLVTIGSLALPSPVSAQGNPLPGDAEAALRRACDYFHRKVSTHGGYLWRYSEDLGRREGEGQAHETTVWVQPPGTPSVGEAFLQAYRATGDKYYLDLAQAAAAALVQGQLHSGGWDYRIEFLPRHRGQYAYRDGGNPQGKNVTTLDDNTTQAALRLLMHVDEALDFKDATIHAAVAYALNALLKAQYPNGAWPQRFEHYPDPANFLVKKANYPESWSRTYSGEKYASYYTFNDNSLADVVDVLFEAARRYHEPRYKAAAVKAGDFILLAQMPDPQPAWAQQYNLQMQPAWARKFEPPSITGGESQGVLRILLRIYRETGEQRFLQPVPQAIAYLQASRLSDGRLARFYELETNKPLYFTKDYRLTYDDSDLPTHYGFKVSDGTKAIAREYERLAALTPTELAARNTPQPKQPSKPSPNLEAEVKAVIAAMDKQGRWVEAGKLKHQPAEDTTDRVIDCRTFIKNVGILSSYLAAVRAP